MITTKEEDHGKKTMDSSSTSTSTQWSRLKDPRIVRVSRAFGGKDRHSKVCTVRGLRDRRVRLSVPTAIQLYDLQDRLGLNQPSKVVDWLLDAAKHEINELPPLHMPNFGPNHQALLIDPTQSNKEELKINSSVNWEDSLGLARSNLWDFDANLRDKAKEVATDEVAADEDEKWNRRNEDEKQGNVEISPNNFFPTSNQLSIPGLLNNVVPYNSFYRLEPSSFSFAPQTEGNQNFNVGIAQPYFPSNLGDFDPKQINQFHLLSSGSQNPLSNSVSPNLYATSQLMKPLQLSMAPNNNDEFPPK